jgi:tyrosyl-DNA phosphodiesterase 1
MGTDIINLDSDDDFLELQSNTYTAIPTQSKTVELISDGSDGGSDIEEITMNEPPKQNLVPTLETLQDESLKYPANDVTTEPIQENIIKSEPALERKLTPQELMRKKLAEAAENRLKRKVEQVPVDKQVEECKRPMIDQTSKINNFNKPTMREKPLPSKRTTTLMSTSIGDNTSRIRMIANPTYCSEFLVDGDKDAVSLGDLIGSPDLVKTYQFNMLIDFEYFIRFVSNKSCEFVLVNKSTDDFLHIEPPSWEKYNIKTIDASGRLSKYGTHHTKMMVNFFRDGSCQIVVHTMNLTQADHLLQTQMCWVSPPLQLHTNPSDYLDFNSDQLDIKKETGTVFKRDFIAYLLKYHNPDMDALINKVGRYDFSPIDVIFVASAPGEYKYDFWDRLIKPTAKPMFGYGRLWQVIHMLDLQSLSGKFICQVSTLAGPCDSYRRNTFVHLLTSCAEKGFPLIKNAEYKQPKAQKHKLEPLIVWPTEKEIVSSKGGPLSGMALHLTISGKWAAYQRQYDDIKRYFYKWTRFTDEPRESKAGRSNLSPHVKTYTVTEDNFKTLKWFLMTSANNSHQAWGKYQRYDDISYVISSYEAGIFVAPELLRVDSNTDGKKQVLVPCYGRDDANDVHLLSENKYKIGMRLPYDTPLEPYGENDQPWAKPDCEKYFQ